MPAHWTLFTWNTQGNFTNDAKMMEINALGRELRMVGLVQEGGVGNAGLRGRWQAFGGQGIGAYNERCTNYVLVDAMYARFSAPTVVELQDKDKHVLVGGGEAGRTPAAVGMGDTLYISWHSLASSSNEDTANLIRTLEGNYARTYAKVIIGGDFNTDPESVEAIISQGSVRQKAEWKYKTRKFFRARGPTHHSARSRDRELDFFIALATSPGETFGFGAAALRAPQVRHVVPSDHDPVLLDLWL